MRSNGEKTIYELFRISIIIKALGAFGEMVTGFAIVFIPDALFNGLATALSSSDISGDGDDFIIHSIVHYAQLFTSYVGDLIGIYIFIRGLAQLLIVLALLRNKLWAYPTLIVILFIVIVTQAYDIYFSHSLFLSAVTLVDIATAYLTWHEYMIVRKVRKKA